MKQNIFIALCLLALIGGSLYVRSQSSYAIFTAAENTGARTGYNGDGGDNGDDGGDAYDMPDGEIAAGADGAAPDTTTLTSDEAAPDAAEEKSLEDIALDRRLLEEWESNKRRYRESGITGHSIRPDSDLAMPHFDISDYTNMIIHTLYVYMEDNPDRFPAPNESEQLVGSSADPRIQRLLYGETKGGGVSGFESGNLAAWDMQLLSGGYTILILARDSAAGKWYVLSEGDVYKLRKEMTDGA
jgi:hypothetical protein